MPHNFPCGGFFCCCFQNYATHKDHDISQTLERKGKFNRLSLFVRALTQPNHDILFYDGHRLNLLSGGRIVAKNMVWYIIDCSCSSQVSNTICPEFMLFKNRVVMMSFLCVHFPYIYGLSWIVQQSMQVASVWESPVLNVTSWEIA